VHNLGFYPELPDHRDYIIDEHQDTAQLFTPPPTLGTYIAPAAVLPSRVDLRRHCSPIEDQGALGSCVAQACVGVMEYVERRAMGRHIEASRLFVYKTGRSLHGWTGDTGLYIRSGMKALKLFGAPPEEYWPHDIERFDEEPSPFAYAYARHFCIERYYKLDRLGGSRAKLLDLCKRVIVYGLPIAFGFVVYSWGDDTGAFPMPQPGQKPYGGHAVVAVGYDDDVEIGESKGALRIRNSWGRGWGHDGYGWLPYDYVTKALSTDFWTIVTQNYVRA